MRLSTVLSGLALSLALAASASAAPLDFPSPEGWKRSPPNNRMRKAQFSVPAVKGDKEGAEVVVFSFGFGGTIQANVDRWKKQVVAGKGDPAGKVTKKTIVGFEMTIVDLQGTYQPTSFMGGKKAAKPNYRVISVVFDTAEGRYFVKLSGPKATVAANVKALHGFLEGIKASGKAIPKPKAPTSKPASAPTSRPS